MPPLAAVPDLDRELDELYGLPLEEFTKARNDLASRLRRAHQSDAAGEVQALRKPTLVVWAANRLARTEPKLVSALVDAGGRLREVQQRALAGQEPASEVDEAAGAERDAVRALLAVARTELERRATAPFLDRLAQTLRAAAVQPESAIMLLRGRLTEELEAVGFGPLEAVAQAPSGPTEDELREAARERVSALRAEARRLDAEARAAERDAEERRREAEAAAAELAEAERDLDARR
ncbi:MAG TPA: hypothetical protein VMH47_05660 [Gaiellaceae bacterium]|nr:hypothetical protein [Gaiellaceae bacterium]